MGRAIVAFLVIVFACACDPGPPPELPPTDADLRSDWFPSESLQPFPLDDAISKGQLDDIRSLLKGGADPNRRWGQSGDRFPLQGLLDHGGASRVEPLETARQLLRHGADPNARWCPFNSRAIRTNGRCTSAQGATPLMFAAAAGQTDIIELLLAAGADPIAKDWIGGSALEYARNEIAFEQISRAMFPEIATRNRNALSYLGEQDAQVMGSTPLQGALTRNDWYPLPPAPPPAPQDDLDSYWRYYKNAHEARMTDRVRTLLSVGADPNRLMYRGGHAGGSDRLPAIVIVMERGQFRVAHTLLQNGAEVNVRWCLVDERDCTLAQGTTPLMWMATHGDKAAVELLLKYGADVTLIDWKGRTAAHFARDHEIQQLVLK